MKIKLAVIGLISVSISARTNQCTEGDDTSCNHMNPDRWDSELRPAYCGKFQSPNYNSRRPITEANPKWVFECSCNDGYRKDNNLLKCFDKNECELNQHRCNRQTQTCENTVGDYKCNCNEGFSEAPYNGEVHCVDRNECNDRNAEVCGPKELYNQIRRYKLCTNTQGGYECDCDKNGFETGNDGKCQDIDECDKGAHDCDTDNGQCINLPGKFKCQCDKGYKLNPNTRKCEDIDECENHQHNCDRRNGACENTEGSFECSCNSGFELQDESAARQKCVDIDECERGEDDCDKENSKCSNTTPSSQNKKSKYQCVCNPGFNHKNNRFDHQCYNIDECVEKKRNPCYRNNQVCVDEVGFYGGNKGFYCECEKGFLQQENGSCKKCVGRECEKRKPKTTTTTTTLEPTTITETEVMDVVETETTSTEASTTTQTTTLKSHSTDLVAKPEPKQSFLEKYLKTTKGKAMVGSGTVVAIILLIVLYNTSICWYCKPKKNLDAEYDDTQSVATFMSKRNASTRIRTDPPKNNRAPLLPPKSSYRKGRGEFD